MQQATALSPSDRTVLEVSLKRMTGDAFGALATLPLICLGDLPTPDPQAIVLDHYDIWHSCLIVAREILRSDGGAAEGVPDALEKLLVTVAELRDAYLAMIAASPAVEIDPNAIHLRIAAAYERLPILVQDLATDLDLRDALLPNTQSLKRTSYERTLRWLGEELQSRAQP